MRASVRTIIAVGTVNDDERTELTATLRIQTLSATSVKVTVTPTRFVRDGKTADPPASQEATLTVDASGKVTKVTAAKGSTAPLGGSLDDLSVLIGWQGRSGRVEVGDRWTTALTGIGGDTGSRTSHATALRVVGGKPCVIIVSSGKRPVVRERPTEAGSLRLAGTEASSTTTAYAFRAGYPARLESSAHGSFATVGAQSQGPGTVTIDSTTTIELVT